MNFGEALTLVKNGHKMQRTGWNGNGMWIELQRPDVNSKMTLPYLFLSYPDGRTVPWLASQTDILENDWQVRDGIPMPTKQEVNVAINNEFDKELAKFQKQSAIVETPKKLHWTQTLEGKKKMAMRRKRSSK